MLSWRHPSSERLNQTTKNARGERRKTEWQEKG